MQRTHAFTSTSLPSLLYPRVFSCLSPFFYFNHSRSVSFSLSRSLFPFLSLTTRSLAVATAVASDTVSNGSGGHTILRLNSTDTAAQRRLFSSHSFLLSLSSPPPLLLCLFLPLLFLITRHAFFFLRTRATILTIIRSFVREGSR